MRNRDIFGSDIAPFLIIIILLLGVNCGLSVELYNANKLVEDLQTTIEEYDARWEEEHQKAEPPKIVKEYDFSDYPDYIEPPEWATGEAQSEDSYIHAPYVISDVLITHYCTCEKCCGRFADGRTADGSVATPGVTVAADLRLYPFGTTIDIGGHLYTVQDTGVTGDHIDVLCSSHEEALQKGAYYTEILVYPNDTYSTD